MRYITLLLLLLVALATLGVDGWDPAPTDCDPEDRVVAGNIHTPCKRVLPELVSAEYRVRKDVTLCREEIALAMPGLSAIEDIEYVRTLVNDEFTLSRGGYGWGYYSSVWNDLSHRIEDDAVIVYHARANVAYNYGRNTAVPERSGFGNPDPRNPNVHVLVKVRPDTYPSYNLVSNAVPRPRTDAIQAMVYACQAQVLQDIQDQEHEAELAKQEAEQDAAIVAQREADRLEQEQAIREAETQAQLASEELAALQERQAKIAETELIKTQTLETQLQHQEVVAGILMEIMRIRMAGEEDRAQITNEYLARMEASAADFDVEMEEVEARIQGYLDFNAQLMQRIGAYQAEVEQRLVDAQAKVAEQMAEIERMNEEAGDTPTEATDE